MGNVLFDLLTGEITTALKEEVGEVAFECEIKAAINDYLESNTGLKHLWQTERIDPDNLKKAVKKYINALTKNEVNDNMQNKQLTIDTIYDDFVKLGVGEKDNVKTILGDIRALIQQIYKKNLNKNERFTFSILSESVDGYERKRRSNSEFLSSLESNVLPTNKVFLREREQECIIKKFDNNNVVFLTGDPGIGKTSLAKSYANYCIKNGLKTSVIFCAYEGGFEKSLDKLDRNGKQRSKDIINYFNSLNQNDKGKILLIIDDFNDGILKDKNQNFEKELESETFKSLRACGIQTIITTRIGIGDNMLEVQPVCDSFALFKEICDEISPRKVFDPTEENEIKEIIELVNKNTLLIVLIAHLWIINKNSNIKEHLKECTTKEESTILPARADNGKTHIKQTIYQQIRSILEFSNINADEAYRNTISNVSLLPLGGMKQTDFIKLSRCDLNDLIYLKDRAWLSINNGIIFMHPVIREIVNNEITLHNFVNCKIFCESINAKIGLNNKIYAERVEYRKYADEIVRAFSKEKSDIICYISYSLSDIYDMRGDYQKAIELAKLVENHIPLLQDKNEEKMQIKIARMYSGIAYSLNNSGNIEQIKTAQRLLETANSILQSITSNQINGKDFIAAKGRVLSNMGSNSQAKAKYYQKKYIYDAKKCHEEALEYRKLANHLLEGEERINNAMDLATSYGTLGTDYYYLQSFSKAVEYHKKALLIRKEYNREVVGNQQRVIGGVIQGYLKEHTFVEKDIAEILQYYPEVIVQKIKNEHRKDVVELCRNFLTLYIICKLEQAETLIELIIKISYEMKKNLLDISKLSKDDEMKKFFDYLNNIIK